MIYLLRHGETLWNVENRLQGQKDSPLTLRGIEQARHNARRLAEICPDHADYQLVASPLARTWQTAVILAETLGLDPQAIVFDPRLMEHGFGAWEGLTLAELGARADGLWQAREADKWNFLVPGGESYARVAARASAWLAEQDPERRLIVVAHGLVGRVLRGLYAGLSQEEITSLLTERHTTIYRLTGGVAQAFEDDDFEAAVPRQQVAAP